MISPETSEDILAEIARNLGRIADALEYAHNCHTPTPDELDPFHDQGNATNHRVSQCSVDYCGEEAIPKKSLFSININA
jgi:hypothetical protein